MHPTSRSSRLPAHGLALLLPALLATPLLAQDGPSDDEGVAPDDSFLRVSETRNKRISLDIAAREYTRPDGAGPMITLVAVAHIGDKRFYQQLQDLLDEHDLVLYESVGPPGTGGAGGKTRHERTESTRDAMKFVAGMAKWHVDEYEAAPKDLDGVAEFAGTRDARLQDWTETASVDAWGNDVIYTKDDAGGFMVKSLGSDGAPGGEGEAADLVVSEGDAFDMRGMMESDDNLQSELAKALDLRFQLEAMSYAGDHWVASDMDMGELHRAFSARDIDFGPLGGTLAGTSFPAKMVKGMLRLIGAADAFMDGAIADMFKVVLIEMLGDESIMEMSLAQFDEGFEEVIVDERNQIVIDDLKAVLDERDDLESVAIFYGAAHMKDMAERLKDQLGYEPGEAVWLRGIGVDLEASAVPPRELAMLRTMIKRTLRQQMAMQRRMQRMKED